MHKLSLITVAAIGAVGVLASAPAAAQDDSYYYGGIGVGQARARFDEAQIAPKLGAGVTFSGSERDERHSAYKVFLGYQFNRHWGAELGYFHMGRFGVNATTTPAGTVTGEFRVQGANIGVVGTLPFTDKLSGQARAGLQFARTRTDFVGTGAAIGATSNPSDRETNVKIGLGLQYEFSPSFMMRGEVERFRVSDALGGHEQVAMYSVSLVMPFGRSSSAARRTAQAPAYSAPYAAPYVAPAPVVAMAPAQVVMVPVAPVPEPRAAMAPLPRRVSYSAESFFGFDRAELSEQGKSALDGFAIELAGTSFETITVQGHADRIGTTAYNQELSLQRAEAVKAYLVNSGGLVAASIVATGKSELEPVTVPEACTGAVTPELIQCLRPDRRVEIEVNGTR